jgi:hypothetical protein
MVLNVNFNNIHLYRGGRFIGGGNRSTQRKPQYPEKTAVPRENRSTQRKPQYPEETAVPRENRSTQRKPQYPEETTDLP